MKEHVSTARDGSGGRAKPALAVLTVAAIGLFFAAELAAPRDVPLGAAVLVPVLVSCFFLDRRLSVAILSLAVFTRAVVATVGDTSIGLAAIESASYIGSVAVALAHRRRAGFIPTRALVDDVVPSGSVPNISPASLETSGLTHRERQVLDMAMHGLTATQIGERLYIGRRTVETHLGRAYSKLGGRTKRELIARAFDDPERTATPPLPDASMRNP